MSTHLESLKTCTPRQIKNNVIRCIQAGLVPYVRSSPGMGKSSIIKQIAAEFGLIVIDIRLAQYTPEDLQGLPRFREIGMGKDASGNPMTRSIAEFVPFAVFPTESTPIPAGYNGWLILLDELSSANKAIQAAAYKLVLDKMVGQERLHPNVAIVCAGNLDTDRAVTNPMSTAMQSRLITLIMSLSTEHFLRDVAYPQGWDSRIIAYLNFKKDALHNFRADHNEHTFCCPRTWEFMNKLIKNRSVTDDDAPLFAGTITAGVGAEFIQFTKMADKVPQLKDILADPDGVALPSDNQARWLAATFVAENADASNLDDLNTYLTRFSAEFRIMFYRMLMVRKPELRSEPTFQRALVELSRYLND